MAPRKQVPIPSAPYPLHGLLPKDETQAASFLKRFNGEYAGQGVRVAVLDTGVDPAAAGLNGKGKVVDIIDCTGSGDIPLQTVEPLKSDTEAKKDTEDGAIRLPGISGRTLLVSSKWSNPTSQWKVGFKRAYDLWPRELLKRRREERKGEWEIKVSTLLSKAKKDLEDFEQEQQKEKKKKKADEQKKASEDAKVATDAKAKEAEKETSEKDESKAKKADLEARVAYLNDFSAEDPGPILDVVAWHDGKDWRAVVGGAEGDGEQNIAPVSEGEASANGGGSADSPAILDLRSHKPMTDYRKELHYERFGTQDLMTYSVNMHMDEDIVSLICASGTHGTHVASIIGANMEGNPEYTGVAPQVEIVSLKIGDSRLGSLETGQALMRATKAILDTKCDICNMSYGEDAAFGMEDRGQFIAMLRDEVIKKRNVLFVAAAGNAGPALTTFGAPGTTSGIIAVGAYETSSMQQAEYALLDSVPAGPYTWSSRGPTYDGARVTVYAPGAAVTGVPTYNLQKSQLMNGTSMASPNACGALSLVLSALKKEKIAYSSARIVKAIEATSKDVEDPLNVGLIQVEALYDYLVANKDHPDADTEFSISITSQGRQGPDFTKPLGEREGMRGVYLREPHETDRLYEASCFVKPSFPTIQETQKAYELDMKLALSTTEPWVKAPDFASLSSAGRAFNIRVDPMSLTPGLHFAEIRAYDTTTPGRLIFTVPVTVCKPEKVSSPNHQFQDWHSSSGHIERKYLAVPKGATWAELRVTSRNHVTPVNLWMHCVQLQPLVRLSKSEKQFVLGVTAGETTSKSFDVVGGVTLEIAAAQFWSSLPGADISLEIQFHGLTLDTGSKVTVVGGSAFTRLQCTSKVRLEQFSPSVSFDRRRTFIRPAEAKITPLGERDVMPNGKRLYQLVASYSFKLSEKTKITPTFPISENLYDNAFSALTTLLDSRKQIVQWASLYGEEKELGKGEYTMKLQIEHEDLKVLEAAKTLPLSLDAQLSEKSKKLSLNVYRDHIDAMSKSESTPYKNIKMPLGETRPLVLASDLKGDTSDLYKTAKAGDVLLGKLKLGPSSAKADFDLTYVLPPQAKSADDAEEKSKDAPLLVDLQLGIVDKIKDDKEKKEFLDSLLASHPKHLPLLVARLGALTKEATEEEVVEAADAVLAEIDENALAIFLGKKAAPAEEQTEAEKKTKKEMEAKKAAWTTAYLRKIEAVTKAGNDKPSLDTLFAKYRQFKDSPESDVDFSIIQAERDIEQKRYGSALKTLKKLFDEDVAADKYEKVTSLQRICMKELGWAAMLEYELRWKLAREPPVEAVW